MNRRKADIAAGLLVAAVLAVGIGSAWDAYRRTQEADGMMSHMYETSAFDPVWYLLGGVLVASVIAGVYVFVRGQLFAPVAGSSSIATGSASGSEFASEPGVESGSESESAESDVRSDAPPDARSNGESAENVDGEVSTRRRTLDLLPEDERRVLEPVLGSPGLTQIELRDRSEFSKSKVSQTVTDLEKRGLLYRERQGRTYRVYPAEELQETERDRYDP